MDNFIHVEIGEVQGYVIAQTHLMVVRKGHVWSREKFSARSVQQLQ